MRRSTFASVIVTMNGLMVACAAPAAAEISGIQGIVEIVPAHPGPQRVGDADSRPFSNAPVRLVTVQGRLVSQAITDAQGQFKLAAPVGKYRVEVGSADAAYPRCDTADVEVRAGSTAQLQVRCDSGMR